jgi:hypothetical protein
MGILAALRTLHCGQLGGAIGDGGIMLGKK